MWHDSTCLLRVLRAAVYQYGSMQKCMLMHKVLLSLFEIVVYMDAGGHMERWLNDSRIVLLYGERSQSLHDKMPATPGILIRTQYVVTLRTPTGRS